MNEEDNNQHGNKSSREDLEALLLAAEARAKEAEDLTKEAVDLKNGTYYSVIDDVWKSIEKRFVQIDFEMLRRKSCPPFYVDSLHAAEKSIDDISPAYKSSRSASSRSASSRSASSRSVSSIATSHINIEARPAITFRRNEQGLDRAHLIPHSTNCAVYYTQIAEAACGVKFHDASKVKRRNVLMFGSCAATRSVGLDGQRTSRTVPNG